MLTALAGRCAQPLPRTRDLSQQSMYTHMFIHSYIDIYMGICTYANRICIYIYICVCICPGAASMAALLALLGRVTTCFKRRHLTTSCEKILTRMLIQKKMLQKNLDENAHPKMLAVLTAFADPCLLTLPHSPCPMLVRFFWLLPTLEGGEGGWQHCKGVGGVCHHDCQHCKGAVNNRQPQND